MIEHSSRERSVAAADRPGKGGRLAITKPILAAITCKNPDSIKQLNIDTFLELEFMGFLRMSECTYTAAQIKCKAFQSKQLTHLDITFFPSHKVLRLKNSKTDINLASK